MIVSENVPEILEGKEIVMIDIMSIVSGTNFRGMLEERVKGLFDELKSSKKYILFIDDMQNVLKSGSKDKDTDLSGMIGDILSGGDVRVIGTITPKEYRNCIESNTSLNSKLQKLVVEPSNEKEAFEIISKSKDTYEKYHNVKYTDEAIRKSIEFAERYITDRSLPDSAFDVIDLAGASAAVSAKESEKLIGLKKSLEKIEQDKTNALNEGEFEKIDSLTSEENKINKEIADFKRQQNANNEPHVIDENDIAETISNMTGIPISKLSSTEKKKIAHIDDVLKKYVIGQDEAVDAICKVIKRNKVGLGDKTKTLANIFLCGRSGTGKSYLAKKLAEEVFGDEKALIRIDMSEYSEKNSVSKLLGAAPSYVGFEKGGQLTEAVKNKQHCVLLLDEIEKADEEVYNVFLQLFDEGRLTDSAGQTINFKNVIVLMTSNIGAKQASELGGGVGFNTDESANKKSIIEKALRQRFTPEFLNRLDKIVYFNDLTDDNLKTIVKLEVKKLDNRLNDLHYKLKCDSKVIDLLHKKAIKQKEFGARPIRRLIQDGLEDKITDLMLENDYKPNYEFSAICTNDKIEIKNKMNKLETFIAKSHKIHGYKYDYSKVNYTNCKEKVCIICHEHGEFWQTPDSHIQGHGCPKCNKSYKLDTKNFIKKAEKIVKEKYGYSKVKYINTITLRFVVSCPEHGEFWQRPNGHLNGKGCSKCAGKNKTTEEFIKEAVKLQGLKYDYSKIKYINATTKVCIICPEHGEFWQTPNDPL